MSPRASCPLYSSLHRRYAVQQEAEDRGVHPEFSCHRECRLAGRNVAGLYSALPESNTGRLPVLVTCVTTRLKILSDGVVVASNIPRIGQIVISQRPRIPRVSLIRR